MFVRCVGREVGNVGVPYVPKCAISPLYVLRSLCRNQIFGGAFMPKIPPIIRLDFHQSRYLERVYRECHALPANVRLRAKIIRTCAIETDGKSPTNAAVVDILRNLAGAVEA